MPPIRKAMEKIVETRGIHALSLDSPKNIA